MDRTHRTDPTKPATPAQTLHTLYPGDLFERPDDTLRAILRTIVVRTNFIPAVRHRIGWRGLNHCTTTRDAWTAKIADWQGVFGMLWEGSASSSDRLTGLFQLNYFPAPDEELVEDCSLRAAAWTQREDYLTLVRRFAELDELRDLFYIGDLQLTLDRSSLALGLNLRSDTWLASRAEDGVRAEVNGEAITLVAPGGWDQHLPAFKLARSFYEVLGASAAFCLETSPSYFRHRRRAGQIVRYWSDGRQLQQPDDTTEKHECRLAFFSPESASGSPADLQPGDVAVTWQPDQPLPTEWQSAPWWQSHMICDFKSLDKQLLGIDDRPALIVLTGFLGSGKTTFLENFVAYQVQRDRFVAVVQNEIGETGLDGKLLGSDNLMVTEIDEGCVCCTLSGRLKPALHQLCSNFRPDFIVLETTGLANPMNFMEELITLSDLVRIDSVTTVVDGPSYLENRVAADIIADQIKSADILLLNKIDLLSSAQVTDVTAQLRRQNPHAAIIPAIRGEVNPALLYSLDPREVPPTVGIHHETSAHHNHLHDQIRSCKITFAAPLNRDRFVHAIENRLPKSILRVKGIVFFSDATGPMVVQYVAGRYEISSFPDRWDDPGFLICIGQQILEERLDRLFQKCASPYSPDGNDTRPYTSP